MCSPLISAQVRRSHRISCIRSLSIRPRAFRRLPILLSEYPFYTVEDVDTYLALLENTPQYLESLCAFEQAKSNAGLFMPPSVAKNVIAQCNSFLNMGDANYLYTTFAERLSTLPKLSASKEAQYLSKNKLQVDTYVLPAFQAFADTMNALKDSGKNDKGLFYFPNGADYYEALVAHSTGSSRTIAELQRLTKKQILADLRAIQASVSETFSSDENDALPSKNILSNPAAIMKDLQSGYTAAFPKGPDVRNTIKYVPKPLEPFLSPAFYLIPAIDDSSENVIYINRRQTMDGIELFTTLAHEGYPGHLYQTTYFAATKSDPVRSILNFGGYTEGWATYTEMMSYYLSPLPDRESALMQKNKSAILGLYALTDMGIHHDGWTLAHTASFFKNYGITGQETIENIYTMILSDPGNYLQYYIGYLEFLELKRACAAKEKDSFSQKKFHQTLLETGPAPFEILAKKLGL